MKSGFLGRRRKPGYRWGARALGTRLLTIGLVTGTVFVAGVSERTSASTHPRSAPIISAHAAFVMNAVTGQTLFAYHPAQERYPASTVKIMTAIVALQHLKLKAVVKVHADAAYVGGTTAGLSEGEQLKVRSLLYGMLLPSGNDAATTLGDAVAGSSWKFAQMMNAEAGKLHLWHTHFVSPTGLDQPGEYTTARDLAWLGRDLLQNQILAEIVHTKYHVAQSFYGQYFHRWTSINQLLWTYRGAIGVKTGTTDAAGANLVAAAKRGGHRIIVVVMGDSKANRFGDATALLNYGWSLEGL